MSLYQKLSTEESEYPPSESPSPSPSPPPELSGIYRFSNPSSPSRIAHLAVSSVLLVLLLLLSLSLAPASLLSHLLSTDSPSTHFASPSIEWSTNPPARPPNNATIVILVNPGSNMHQKLLPTLANIEERFNRRLGYPIQLLTNDQLPSEEIRNKTEWITGGKARWSIVTEEDGWGHPEWITPEEIQHSVQTIGFSEGYRNMCRFYSMFHSKHAALRDFEYIWRLDDTSRFHCTLMEDPIELMKNSSAIYGFSQIQFEAFFVVPTLWKTTLAFIEESKAKEKGWIREGEGENWLDLISEDGGRSYNLKMFYNKLSR
ncbi:hypothetical protein JCM3765_002264 [Sporobolomyces pararoseus]